MIGELGAGGFDVDEKILTFREIQRNVTELEEFKNNTVFVPTAQYVVMNGTTFNGDYHYFGRADTYFHIGNAFADAMAGLLGWSKKTSEEESAEATVTKISLGSSGIPREETHAGGKLSGQSNAADDMEGNR